MLQGGSERMLFYNLKTRLSIIKILPVKRYFEMTVIVRVFSNCQNI